MKGSDSDDKDNKKVVEKTLNGFIIACNQLKLFEKNYAQNVIAERAKQNPPDPTDKHEVLLKDKIDKTFQYMKDADAKDVAEKKVKEALKKITDHAASMSFLQGKEKYLNDYNTSKLQSFYKLNEQLLESATSISDDSTKTYKKALAS